MDLLFKNPKYFFETYFGISLIQFALLFVIISIALCMCDALLHKRKRYAWVFCFSFFLTIVFTVSLLNPNREMRRDLIINPFIHLKEVLNGNTHFIRETLSNILLYVPIGIMFAVAKVKWPHTLAFIFLLSFGIELLQYTLSRGCFETADIIFNFLGGIIGYIIGLMMTRLHKRVCEDE